MKDEIKEILDDIRFVAEEPTILQEENEDGEIYTAEYDNFLYLSHKQDKILYDYITNLRQKYQVAINQSIEDHKYASKKEDEVIALQQELKQFNINLDDIKENNNLFDNIHEAIQKMRLYTLSDKFEVVLNNNLIECKEKLTNYRTILGCKITYDNLDKNVSFIVREDKKPSYEELEKRMYDCAKYLHSIENHDFSADIPISILSGDVDKIKKYLDRQIEIYKEDELEFTDEINCLKDIFESQV